MENKLTVSELRIGNYLLIDGIAQKVEAFMPNENEVKFNKGDYFKISFEHHKHNLTYETASDENVEPIPLTEEWLLKFGFNKRKIYFELGKLAISLNGIEYDNGRTYFNSWTILEKQPEYVHQLQNLYFALTNEELIIK